MVVGALLAVTAGWWALQVAQDLNNAATLESARIESGELVDATVRAERSVLGVELETFEIPVTGADPVTVELLGSPTTGPGDTAELRMSDPQLPSRSAINRADTQPETTLALRLSPAGVIVGALLMAGGLLALLALVGMPGSTRPQGRTYVSQGPY